MGGALSRAELEDLGRVSCDDVYSVEVPGTATEDSTPIRRNVRDTAPELAAFGCKTAHEAFLRAVDKFPDAPCLGWRPVDELGNAAPFVFETYSEVAFRVRAFGAGLAFLKLINPNERGMRLLGFHAPNRREWFVAEQACYARRVATVPFYDSFGAAALAAIINETNLSTVLTAAKNLETLLAAQEQCPSLAHVIVMEPVTHAQRHACGQRGLALYSYAEVCAAGEAHACDALPAQPGDIATFCYTSGTTGNPKGAMLTHENLVSGSAGIHDAITMEPLGPESVHLSYLPLPHVFERMVQLCVYSCGGRVGFFRGDPLKLFEDVNALQPTVFALVPRVVNKLYDKVMMAVADAPTFKAALFRRALRVKLRGLQMGRLKNDLWDSLVFGKVKAGLGFGSMKVMVIGSAPVAPHVLSFMRVLAGVPIAEGYGQTEGSGVTTLSHLDDVSTGHVGGPVPSVELKLMSVPSMGYLVTDTSHAGVPCRGRGEVCLRGPSVFRGYYVGESPVDADGWLHSGDIGLFTETGALQLIDRIKNIFKLAQGEFVAPEKVEAKLQDCGFVAQAFVYGDSLRNYLVAVVVPDFEAFAAAAGPNAAGREVTPGLVDKIVEQMRVATRRMPKYQVPKKILVTADEFTPENGLLTPTFKVKRKLVEDKYMREINLMYNDVNAAKRINTGLTATVWVSSKL